MIRSILSIIIPVVTWGVLSVSANFAIYAMMPARFDENMIPNDPITLLIFLLLCTVLCILAGFLCAMIARSNPMKHVWILAAIQLAIGIMVQIGVWDQLPLWYHLLFLAQVMPMHLVGGKLRNTKRQSTPTPQPA